MSKFFRTDELVLEEARVLAGTIDPAAGAGVPAPEGSLYLRHVAAAGELYIKTGAADTEWTAASGGGSGGWATLEVQEPNGVDEFDFTAVLDGNNAIYRIIGFTEVPEPDTSIYLRMNGVTFDPTSIGFNSYRTFSVNVDPISHDSFAGLVLAKTAGMGAGDGGDIFFEALIMGTAGLGQRSIMCSARVVAESFGSLQTNQEWHGVIPSGWANVITSLGLKVVDDIRGSNSFEASRFYLQQIIAP